jgi:Copper resistance protein D
VKTVLFVGMLWLAAQNRFFLVPRLIKSNEFGEQTAAVLMRLRRHILSEQVLGVVVILIVSAVDDGAAHQFVASIVGERLTSSFAFDIAPHSERTTPWGPVIFLSVFVKTALNKLY